MKDLLHFLQAANIEQWGEHLFQVGEGSPSPSTGDWESLQDAANRMAIRCKALARYAGERGGDGGGDVGHERAMREARKVLSALR